MEVCSAPLLDAPRMMDYGWEVGWGCFFICFKIYFPSSGRRTRCVPCLPAVSTWAISLYELSYRVFSKVIFWVKVTCSTFSEETQKKGECAPITINNMARVWSRGACFFTYQYSDGARATANFHVLSTFFCTSYLPVEARLSTDASMGFTYRI